MKETKVKQGVWLYDSKFPSKVILEFRNISYGSGDYEDSPELRDDVYGEFLYLLFYSPNDENCILSRAGPFNTISEAEAHCIETTNGTIRWE